jgi:type I restriction enzyme S subunit
MSEVELPVGWALSKLEEVATWGSGGTPRAGTPEYYEGGTIPWAIIGDLTDGIVQTTATKITPAAIENSSAKIVEPGTVLVAMYGSIGKLGITAMPMATNQAIACGVPTGAVTKKYLMWWLRSQRSELIAAGRGGTQMNISQTVLKPWPIKVAPLQEQVRIVAELERRLSHVDQSVQGIQQAKVRIRLAKMAFLQDFVLDPPSRADSAKEAWSYFESVCEELEKPFQLPTEQCDSLPTVALGDVLAGIEAGKSYACEGRSADSQESGVLKVSAMSWGTFLEEENKAIPSNVTPRPQDEVRSGDLLLSRANTDALVGASVLVGDCRERLYLSDKSLRLVPATRINKQWLQAVLASPHVRAQMTAFASGTKESMRNITQPNLRKVSFPLLCPVDQERAVTELSRRMSLLEATDRSADACLRRAEQLRRSLLAAAFSGKLVPQDSSDEPAEELLERIRTERHEAQAAAKAAKKTTKKPAARKTSTRKKETQP